MELSLSIASAAREDIPAITRLINNAYRGDPGSRGWTSEGVFMEGERTSEADMERLFDQPEKENFKCCTPEKEILGFVSLEKKSDSVYLGLLTVSPDAQASGIGRQLLEFAESHARDLHKPAIVITVINIRTELVAWYGRRGYLPTGKIEFFPPGIYKGKVPLHLIEMKKEISPLQPPLFQ
jgi:N-acetylglutamate synthase-like GNAT family acetyltransferase